MTGLKKEKNETLKEFAARVPKNTWAEIPQENLTRDEFLMLKGNTTLERMRFLAEDGSDRDLAIQMSGHLETHVRELLHANSTPKMADDMFGKKGKVRDHALRIDLAECFGLISREDAQELRNVARIRNRFGHDPDLYHFDHDPEIVSWTKSIRFNGTTPKLTLRMRFFWSTYSLLSRFENSQVGYGKSTLHRTDYTWRWCDENVVNFVSTPKKAE